jgi:DNA polymerase-4
MSVPRRILLADADQFFVAVARLVDPEGAGKTRLLIVGGRPGSRGVVCSASYETRAFGVRSGMPIGRALRLCPDALSIPVPRGACSKMSRAIRAVLEQFTPIVRGASIDEWYLDLTGTEALYHHESLAETAARIRRAVLDATGLSVSFGGGTNRLIAKLAVEFGKPKPGTDRTGVFVVEPGQEATFMKERVLLADIPGIGPRFQQALAARELKSVADVLPHDVTALERWYGARAGQWLWRRARGLGDATITVREPAKSISHEDTFRKDVSNEAAIKREVAGLAAKTASDMRDQRLMARTVTVKLKYTDFSIRSASRTVKEPIESDKAVTELAMGLLDGLRRRRRAPIRLAGVGLSGLADAADRQPGLFDAAPSSAGGSASAETPRDRQLSRAVDVIRGKFGDGAVQRGAGRDPTV